MSGKMVFSSVNKIRIKPALLNLSGHRPLFSRAASGATFRCRLRLQMD